MLTDTALRHANPGDKAYKLADERGLYVWVSTTGARCWRLKYRFGGKEKVLAFGVYPEVSLAEARQRRDDARRQLRDGIDPGAQRREQKAAQKAAASNTFGDLAAEWLAKQKQRMAPATYTKAEWMFTLCRPLDARPVAELTVPDVLAVLRPIEARGSLDTAHAVKARIGRVLRYAVTTGRANRDVTADMDRDALAPIVVTNRPAVTNPHEVGALLRAIDGYTGEPATCAALKLAPLLFVRPGNLRAMEWAELDLDDGVWRIPAGKMKMREAHVVPLAPQAVAILRELHQLTGRGRYCFPSLRTHSRPMSENTINAALRRLGYAKDVMTGHGFRAMASTLLNEQGWAPDVIELQLAHKERNQVRAAYNRAERIAERTKMMRAWANYLDTLKAGTTNVVAIKRRG